MTKKEEPKGTLTFRIDARLRERLEKFAEQQERSVGFVVGKAIEEYLRKEAK
jgi:predicted transcriptional regulator